MTTLIIFYYLISFLCLSVTYSLTVGAGVTTTPVTSFYEVTTRSRAKLLQGVEQEATKPISPDSVTSSSSKNTTTTSRITVSLNTDTSAISDDVLIATSSDYHDHYNSPKLPSSSVRVSYFETSNFQIVETTTFETHPNLSEILKPTKLCHNSLTLKTCTMEADCEDNKPSPSSSVPSPDPMDKIQQLFSSLSAQIASQNVTMSQDFRGSR